MTYLTIGYVPQRAYLFTGTVEMNVSIRCSTKSGNYRARCRKCMSVYPRQMNLSDRLEGGLPTYGRSRGTNLSGGRDITSLLWLEP